jgi:hypothetical protein
MLGHRETDARATPESAPATAPEGGVRMLPRAAPLACDRCGPRSEAAVAARSSQAVSTETSAQDVSPF